MCVVSQSVGEAGRPATDILCSELNPVSGLSLTARQEKQDGRGDLSLGLSYARNMGRWV